MTVCIAALADHGKSLITARDSMLSMDATSGDQMADKMYPLSDRFKWWAMISGNNLTHIVPVIDYAQQALLPLTDDSNRADVVAKVMAVAYQQVRSRHAEDDVLSSVGLDWELFRQRQAALPDVSERLRAVDLGFELLVCGFDNINLGHIFTVRNPGACENNEVVGYAAIGSGAWNAYGSLMFHSANSRMDLGLMLYHVCEAKFMAESAAGVGRHTSITVTSHTGDGAVNHVELPEAWVDGIRSDWEKHGRPRVPPNIGTQMSSKLRGYFQEMSNRPVRETK